MLLFSRSQIVTPFKSSYSQDRSTKFFETIFPLQHSRILDAISRISILCLLSLFQADKCFPVSYKGVSYADLLFSFLSNKFQLVYLLEFTYFDNINCQFHCFLFTSQTNIGEIFFIRKIHFLFSKKFSKNPSKSRSCWYLMAAVLSFSKIVL